MRVNKVEEKKEKKKQFDSQKIKICHKVFDWAFVLMVHHESTVCHDLAKQYFHMFYDS